MSTIAAPDRSPATSSRSASALNLIGGTWVEGRGNTSRDIYNPADTAEMLAPVREAAPEQVDEACAAAARAFPGWRHPGAGSGPRPVQVPGAAGKELLGRGTQHRPRKRQAVERGARLAAARARRRRLRLRHPLPDDGTDSDRRFAGCRLPHHPRTYGRGGRHSAIQFPGLDPAVDDVGRRRLREHVPPQARREGAAHRHPTRGDVRRRRLAAGRRRRGAGEQGRQRTAHRQPACPGGFLRRHVGCGGVGLQHRGGSRQARSGARRSEEPSARPARCRPGADPARPDRIVLRLRGTALSRRERAGGGRRSSATGRRRRCLHPRGG